jgi:hypothetical protein
VTGADHATRPVRTIQAVELALRGDFDLDTVSDFGIAGAEACAAVVANAEANETLLCRFTTSQRHVEINATVRLRTDRAPRVDPLTLRHTLILNALLPCPDTSPVSRDLHRIKRLGRVPEPATLDAVFGQRGDGLCRQPAAGLAQGFSAANPDRGLRS